MSDLCVFLPLQKVHRENDTHQRWRPGRGAPRTVRRRETIPCRRSGSTGRRVCGGHGCFASSQAPVSRGYRHEPARRLCRGSGVVFACRDRYAFVAFLTSTTAHKKGTQSHRLSSERPRSTTHLIADRLALGRHTQRKSPLLRTPPLQLVSVTTVRLPSHHLLLQRPLRLPRRKPSPPRSWLKPLSRPP